MEKITVVACEPNPERHGYDALLSNGETVFSKGAYPIGVEYVEQAKDVTLDRQIVRLDFTKQAGFVEIRYCDRGGDEHEYFELIASDLAIIGRNVLMQEEVDKLVGENTVLLHDIEIQNGTLGERTAEIQKLREDNAMLARGLDEANAAMAALSTQNGKLAKELLKQKHARDAAPIPASLTGVTTRDVADLPRVDQLPAHPVLEAGRHDEFKDTRTDVEKHLDTKRKAATSGLADGVAERMEAEFERDRRRGHDDDGRPNDL